MPPSKVTCRPVILRSVPWAFGPPKVMKIATDRASLKRRGLTCDFRESEATMNLLVKLEEKQMLRFAQHDRQGALISNWWSKARVTLRR